MRAVAWCLLALLGPVAAAAAQEPTRQLARAQTCRVGEAVEIGTSPVRTLRAELAFAPDGRGLVVWPTGEHELQTRPLVDGVPGDLGPAVRVDRAIGLNALAAVERGFVAVASAPLCSRYGAACLRAIALGRDGAALGPAYEPAPRDQWNHFTARVTLPDALVLAWAPRWSSSIELFRIADDGSIAPESHPLRADCTADAPITALAADRGSVVAFGRSCDAPESQRFVLALGGRRQPLYALPAAAEVERFTSDGGVATVVYRSGRLRRRLVRVAVTDGHVIEGPIVLEPGTLPADVADVVVPELAVQRGRLVLRRSDVAGAPIGEPVEIAPARGRVTTRLAWSGDRFFVLHAARDGRTWTLQLRSVSCALRTPTPAPR